MYANKLLIAAAGSGKTTHIINDIKDTTKKVLITTFTQANEQSIRKKLAESNKGCIPQNVTVQTWFSFLIEHGVKPYQYWDERVMGMELVSTASGLKYRMKNGTPVFWGEADFYKFYFNQEMDVYSDKLSKLVFNCNKKSAGYVIKRLEKIFSHIYIDEVQDMAGWDLELIKLFMLSSISITMVGDPRQTVYLTHHDRKFQKYTNGKIIDFIQSECKKLPCIIDETTLNVSFRNSAEICALSSRLFSNLPECKSGLTETNEHMGIFFVKNKKFDDYFSRYNPMQLRYSNSTVSKANAAIMNFGESKGLEFSHVLIYPTKDMLKWLCSGNSQLEESTRAKLYVAITRAFFSVGIVVEDSFNKTAPGISIWVS